MDSRNDLKEKLLDASMKLFLRKGFAGTTVNEIADLAGVSKGGLYWYFKSKEEIVAGIVDRYRHEFIEEIVKKMESSSGDFATKFRAFYKFTTEFALENREQLLVFSVLLIEFSGTGIALEKKMKEIHNSYTLAIERLIEEGIRQGEIGREIDPAVYAMFFTSTLVGSMLHWYLANLADPVYDRRYAIAQRDALLKVVLSGESSVRDRK